MKKKQNKENQKIENENIMMKNNKTKMIIKMMANK